MIADMIQSLKGKFKRQKNDVYEKDELESFKDPINHNGEINIEDDLDPEDRANGLKKKRIMIACVIVGAVAVVAVASNVFFSPKPEQKDKPLSAATNNVGNPTQGLPSKYSDLGKYNKDADQKNGVVDPNNPNNSNGNLAGKQNVQNTNTRTYAATPSYSSPPRSSGATYVPTTYAGSSANTGSYSGGNSSAPSSADKAAIAEAKEREAVTNSALAFKIAMDVVQGKSPDAALTANAITTPALQQMPYRYSDEETMQSIGSFALTAGTVIQATLLTGITSDVPNGDVVAQIRQNVYDSQTGTHLLIPQGSRIIGVSGAAGGNGNKRIGVVFKRIILPNGASLTLPDQKAIDGVGYPGLADIYNDHQGKTYSTAFTSALLGALAQSATGNSSGSDTRSSGQEAVSGAVASILQTGEKMVEKDLNVNATIEIEPGFQFSVFINQDLLIGEYVDF